MKSLALFSNHIPKADRGAIRTATSKAQGLGNDRFKAKVEKILNRQVQQKPRGDDRRSEIFKNK